MRRTLFGRTSKYLFVAPDAAMREPSAYKHVLFFRNFQRFQGGHLKIWHYYNHVVASGTHIPYIALEQPGLWDGSNPWNRPDQRVLRSAPRRTPDVYFLAGRDWKYVDPTERKESRIPIINFMQHARHADPDQDLYQHLANRAIRICVDPSVEDAIVSTGQVSGPIFTIQNGIDIRIEEDAHERDLDLLIVAVKRPEIGRRLHRRIVDAGVEARLFDSLVAREDLLEGMRRARTTLFLPNREEGAYLPPMEAMALGSLVVCPDHVGSSYCRDGVNAMRPAFDDESVVAAVTRSLTMDPADHDTLVRGGFDTVKKLTLDAERDQFLAILRQVDDLWRDAR